MSVGFVMLCHNDLARAAQVARHWAENDCPVVIHVDKRTKRRNYDKLVLALEGLDNIPRASLCVRMGHLGLGCGNARRRHHHAARICTG